MLLEYAAAASRLPWMLQPALRREPELVNLQEGQLTQTVWEQMAKKINVQGVAGADEAWALSARLHPDGRT